MNKIPATHCRHGHPWNDENIRFNNRGDRYCVACQRAQGQAYHRRRKAKEPPRNPRFAPRASTRSITTHCRHGHSWSETLRFDHRGTRYCAECRRESDLRRRLKGPPQAGPKKPLCRHGHPMIEGNIAWSNSWVCLTCKRAVDARPRKTSPELFQEILRRARLGETANALSGRKSHRGNVVLTNSITIVHLSKLKTPEGKELKQLLASNAKMSRFKRFGVNSWLTPKREFLAAQFERTRDLPQVTLALNQHFGSSHSERNVQARASKWGFIRLRQNSPVIAPVSATLRLPAGSLMERLVELLPKNLARDHRDDLISEIALAVFEGRVPEAELEAHVRVLVRRSFNADHDQWGDVSLDTTIPGTDLRRIDTISEGLWE